MKKLLYLLLFLSSLAFSQTTTITALPAASSAVGADVVAADQGGTTTRKVTVDQLAAYIINVTSSTIYAPLASPAFTGVPTVPTAAGGTNNNQAASTQFVTSAVGAVGGSVPWTSWTPTITGSFSGTPSTIVCRYRYNSGDKVLTIWYNISGTATTPAAAFFTFTLPLSLTASSLANQTFWAQSLSSSAQAGGMLVTGTSSNVVTLYKDQVGTGNYGTSGVMGGRGMAVIEVN